MGENSKIEWCDHTASPWHGCEKVAVGCDNCYAAQLSLRNPGTLGIWGPDGVRVKSKSFAKTLRLWNSQAEKSGKQVTVFPSLCDPFEDRPELVEWRQEMFDVIDECPWVTLLLVTKRPENVRQMWPVYSWHACNTGDCPHWLQSECDAQNRHERDNVWIGCSIATQADADRNIPHLLKCRDLSPVLFVSAEPLLGPVDLEYPSSLFPDGPRYCCNGHECGCQGMPVDPPPWLWPKGESIDWVIAGGESGPGARPMHPDWARSLRDQCKATRVPFLFKQWGGWAPTADVGTPGFTPAEILGDRVVWLCADGRSSTQQGRPDDFADRTILMSHVGKARAGRLLDGVEHSEFPQPHAPV